MFNWVWSLGPSGASLGAAEFARDRALSLMVQATVAISAISPENFDSFAMTWAGSGGQLSEQRLHHSPQERGSLLCSRRDPDQLKFQMNPDCQLNFSPIFLRLLGGGGGATTTAALRLSPIVFASAERDAE